MPSGAESTRVGSFFASARAAFAGRAAEAEGAGATVLLLRPSDAVLLALLAYALLVLLPKRLRRLLRGNAGAHVQGALHRRHAE